MCGIVWCYVGSGGEGRRHRPPAGRGARAADARRPPDAARDAPGRVRRAVPARPQWYWRADFVYEVPDEAVELPRPFGSTPPSMKSTMHLYPIDGAAHDVGASETAWSYRDATGRRCSPGSTRIPPTATRSALELDYQEALHPYSAGGAYVNMMMDEGEDRVRASYRGNYERLAQIKRAYDPENVFQINQNIRPAAPEGGRRSGRRRALRGIHSRARPGPARLGRGARPPRQLPERNDLDPSDLPEYARAPQSSGRSSVLLASTRFRCSSSASSASGTRSSAPSRR